MNTNWDSITWVTETVPEENEVRVRMEGKITDIDDETFRKVENGDVEVSKLTLEPGKER